MLLAHKAVRIGVTALAGLAGWVATAGVVAPPASACLLAPGQLNCTPDILSVSANAVKVAEQTGTETSSPPGDLTFSYDEQVWRDPNPANNPAGSTCAPNCLTWLLSIKNVNTSSITIASVTVSNFSGFITDVGINSSAPAGAPSICTPNVAPTTVSRSSTGSIITWEYNNEIVEGGCSVLLEVETNATTVKPGTVTVQNDQAANGPGLAPALPEGIVPLLGLVGGALAGGFAVRRRLTR